MNERIIVHPPKKDKSEKYYVTVSYYVNGIRKQKRKTGFKKSSDAKEEGLKIRKVRRTDAYYKSNRIRVDNIQRICRTVHGNKENRLDI